jgi:hypothetical protein
MFHYDLTYAVHVICHKIWFGHQTVHDVYPDWILQNQWRNIIAGGPRFKIFEGLLVEVPKARVECRICTSFLGCPGHAHPENFLI